MHSGCTGRIDNNRVHIDGVSYGYGDSALYLIRRGKRHLVVHKKGTQDFGSRGASAYSEACWYLVRVKWLPDIVRLDVPVKARFMVTALLERREPGRQWRQVKLQLIENLIELEAPNKHKNGQASK